MNKRTRSLVIISIAYGLVATGLVVFLYLQLKPPTTNTAQPATQTQSKTDSTNQVLIPVKVYFSKHPESDDDPAKVFAVSRLAADLGVANFALTQLLAGPTAQESANGYFSTVHVRSDASTCEGKDFSIAVKDTVATVKFCRTFDAIGVVSDGQAQSAIEATLLQFASIKKVIVLTKDGNCQFDMSGENFCLQ